MSSSGRKFQYEEDDLCPKSVEEEERYEEQEPEGPCYAACAEEEKEKEEAEEEEEEQQEDLLWLRRRRKEEEVSGVAVQKKETGVAVQKKETKQKREVAAFEDLKAMPLTLPPNIYTSAMVAWLGFQDPLSPMMLIILPQWFLLLLNIVFQIGFIHIINNETKQVEVCDTKTSLPLMYLAVGLFSAVMIQEFAENADMLGWTWYVKTEKTHKEIRIKTWTVHTTEGADEDGEDETKTELSTGLTLCEKIMFVMLVVVPKVAIAVLLTQCGIKFVALSETDADLVLNCLTMAFVVEIDEMIYNTFSPPWLRDVLEHLPPINADKMTGAMTDALENLGVEQGILSLALMPWLKVGFWGCLVKVATDQYVCAE